MIRETTFAEAVNLASNYIALGQTDIYLYDDDKDDRPWEFITEVEAGGSYRLSGPASVRFKAAHPSGLTFSWSVDFEGRDANGRGVSLFERDRLRNVARKLSPGIRRKFASFLASEVLPGMRKRTAEIRQALNDQEDSENLVVGLIAFATDSAK